MATTSGPEASPVVIPPVIPEVPVTVDSKGRVRVSKEQRRLILGEFENSRMEEGTFSWPKHLEPQITKLKLCGVAGFGRPQVGLGL